MDMDRRRLLHGLSALLLLAPLCLTPTSVLAADAGGPADDPKNLYVPLPPLLLPGREKFTFVRLELSLVMRRSEKIVEEVALVNAYKPRIIGVLTQDLPEDTSLSRGTSPSQFTALKAKVRGIANEIIGQPMIADVLIVSFLTG